MQKRHFYSLFQLLFTAAALYTPLACTRIYYHPNMHNVPMLKEKGDIRANIALSQGNEVAGIEAQGAYALKKNVGLMLNYLGAQASGGIKNGRGAYLEGAGGYFSTLGKHGIFDAYMGAGAGSLANFYAYADKKSHYPIYFAKAYIQPSGGFHSKIFDAALSCRLGTVYYFPYNAPDSVHLYGLQGAFQIENQAYVYAEPAITVRGGYKFVKLQAQLGTNFMNFPKDVSRSQVNFNLGLYMDISEMAKAWGKDK